MQSILTTKMNVLLYLAWLIAVAAILGSLYFSNILGLPPCDLCWWQRIFIYPIAVLLLVGLWRKDVNVPYYVIPLAGIGLLFAVYHNLIYEGIIPEAIQTCTNGVSCTTPLVELFGFVSIPLLSLLAYGGILVLNGAYIVLVRRQQKAI